MPEESIMQNELDVPAGADLVKRLSADQVHEFEARPLTRQEYISAMVHFYRGELARANAWRIRLDTSSNWAVVAAIGLLSFAFGVPEHSHASILFGMILIFHFLALEGRRYRFFDLWRYRLRLIEENFYGPIVARDLHSPDRNWGKLMAGDLLRPQFKISYWQALRARLVSNYLSLFVMLLLAWLGKLLIQPALDGRFWHQMSIGPIPWYLPLSFVGVLYTFLAVICFFVKRVSHPDLDYLSREDSAPPQVDF